MAFEDIAQKIARATIAPSPAAGLIGEPGKTVGEGITAELSPFRQAEKKDIITGEYARSPYRLQLAQQTGVKRWADISSSYENARNAYLNFVPGKVTKVPKTEIISTEFNKDFMRAMKPGDEQTVDGLIVGKNSKRQFTYKLAPGDDWSISTLGLNKAITDKIGKKIESEQEVPGEFEEKEVGGTGKTKEQLKKEMDEIGQLYNRIVHGKSELEAYLEKYRREQATGGLGREGASKLYTLKFNAYEAHLKKIEDKDKGVLAEMERKSGGVFSSILGRFVDFSRDINFSLVNRAVEEGKAASVENATLNSFKLVDEKMVDGYLNDYQRSINNDIALINDMPQEADRLMASYALLMKIAPTAGGPAEAVTGAVGERMLMESLGKGKVIPSSDFHGGNMNLFRFQDDYKNMTETVLNARSPQFKVPIEKKGQNLFERNLDLIRKNVPAAKLPKLIPVFRSGVTTENINETVRKNLLEDWNLAKLAPRTPEAWATPTRTQQKWIALYESVYGRKPTFSDTKKIVSPEQTRQKGFKFVSKAGQQFP